MTGPLPTSEAPALPATDDRGTPWAEYVRTIEFVDPNPVQTDQPPVHVMRHVLLDGQATIASIAKDGITVDLSGEGGTIVTLHVWHEDVQIGDETRPYLIGGRPVLTPVGEGWTWEPLDPENPADLIVCSIYVAEVHVR